MFDVMADWLTVPLLQHEGGKSPRRVGLAHPSIAPYGVFATQDGRQVLISIQSEREWAALCTQVLDKPGLPSDLRFSTNVARVANRRETDGIVARIVLGDDRGRAPGAADGGGHRLRRRERHGGWLAAHRI